MDKNKKGRVLLSISKAILAATWEIGSITAKAFFPHPYSHAFCRHRDRQSIYLNLHRLKKRGLISNKEKGSTTFYLTQQGKKEAFWSHLDAQVILRQPQKQKWDGQWRMVLFDIPEKKRRHRDYLRDILKTLGFKELQKSIWVTPYKIPAFLKELLWEENIKPHTRFITVKEIDFDRDLRKCFRLKS